MHHHRPGEDIVVLPAEYEAQHNPHGSHVLERWGTRQPWSKLAGVLADAAGIGSAIVVIAAIAAAGGVDVAIRMGETLHRPPLPVTPA